MFAFQRFMKLWNIPINEQKMMAQELNEGFTGELKNPKSDHHRHYV